MAYFQCMTAGNKKKIIVTCDDEFAGVTISCTKGGTTLTKTCPSASPYEVEFDVPENGTWTISGTVDGITYSDTITVADVSMNLRYGLDYKAWLTEGGLDPADYSGLDDIFADEKAVRRLMLIHDSADFLANAVENNLEIIDAFCANDTAMKWIGLCDYVCERLEAITGVKAKFMASTYWERYLKDHVPITHGDTNPYGEVIADGVYSYYYKYQAFDRNESTYWCGPNSAFPHYIGYRFQTPICVKKIKIRPDADGSESSPLSRVKDFKVQGSNNNGATWADIATLMAENYYHEDQEFEFDNDEYYLWYRVYVTNSYSPVNYCSVYELQFYGRAYTTAVPEMTSASAPYGTVISSPPYDSRFTAYSAFARNYNGGWTSQSLPSGGAYIGYVFPVPVTIKKVIDWTSTTWVTGRIECSDDGVTWTDVSGTQTRQLAGYMDISLYNNERAARYWRFYGLTTVADSSGRYLFSAYNMNFFGIDYTAKELEEGTTRQWIYDHGVEVMDVMVDDGNGTTITKEDSQIKMVKPAAASSDGVYTRDSIDITPFTIYRMRCGDELTYSGSNRSGILELYKSVPAVYQGISPTAAFSIYGYSVPHAIGIPVSSVNTVEYGEIEIIDAVTQTIEEWWLE